MINFGCVLSIVALIGYSHAGRDCTKCEFMELNSPEGGPVTRVHIEGASKIKKFSLREATSDKKLCEKDYTYGFIGTDVFVDLGCSGRFKVCYTKGYLETIECNSSGDPEFCDYKNGECEVETAIVDEAVSNAPCIRDYSFHAFPDKLIASKNCQGTFVVGCKQCD